MEIKIVLNSPAIQEKFDRGGVDEIMNALNAEFGYIRTEGKKMTDHTGEVLDENGNLAGTWEIVRA